MNADIEESLIYLGASVALWLDPEADRLFAIRFYVGYPIANYADLEPYMLTGILSKYGVPDEVVLDMSSPVYPINLTLQYTSLDLYIQYKIENNLPYLHTDDDSVQVCNNRENILEFQLQVSILPESENLPLGIWGNPAAAHNTGFSIGEVSDLSLKDFTKIFSQPNQCFETLPIGEFFTPQ